MFSGGALAWVPFPALLTKSNQTKPKALLPDLTPEKVRVCFTALATLFVFNLSRMLVQEPLGFYIRMSD